MGIIRRGIGQGSQWRMCQLKRGIRMGVTSIDLIGFGCEMLVWDFCEIIKKYKI